MGGGAAASGSQAGAASGRPQGDPQKLLQERVHELAAALRDVAKPEEGEPPLGQATCSWGSGVRGWLRRAVKC